MPFRNEANANAIKPKFLGISLLARKARLTKIFAIPPRIVKISLALVKLNSVLKTHKKNNIKDNESKTKKIFWRVTASVNLVTGFAGSGDEKSFDFSCVLCMRIGPRTKLPISQTTKGMRRCACA